MLLPWIAAAWALSGPRIATDGEAFVHVYGGGVGQVGPIALHAVSTDGRVGPIRALPAEAVCGLAWAGDRYVLGTVAEGEVLVREVAPDGTPGPERVVGSTRDLPATLAGWQCSLAAADGRVWMAWRTCQPTARAECGLYDAGTTLRMVEVPRDGEAVPVPLPDARGALGLLALDAGPAGPVLYWERRQPSSAGDCLSATWSGGEGWGPRRVVPCDSAAQAAGGVLMRRGPREAALYGADGMRVGVLSRADASLYETVAVVAAPAPEALVHLGEGRVLAFGGGEPREFPGDLRPRYAARAGDTLLVEDLRGWLVWLGVDGGVRPFPRAPVGGLARVSLVVDLGAAALVAVEDADGLRLYAGDGARPPTRVLDVPGGRGAVALPGDGHVLVRLAWLAPTGGFVGGFDRSGRLVEDLAPAEPPDVPWEPGSTCGEAGPWRACVDAGVVTVGRR